MKTKIFILALCAALTSVVLPTAANTYNISLNVTVCGILGDMVGGY